MNDNSKQSTSILPSPDKLINSIRRIKTIMSLDEAKLCLKTLVEKVDAGDIDGGKSALSEMKVRSQQKYQISSIMQCIHP